MSVCSHDCCEIEYMLCFWPFAVCAVVSSGESCFDPNSPNFSAHTHTRAPHNDAINTFVPRICPSECLQKGAKSARRNCVLHQLPNEKSSVAITSGARESKNTKRSLPYQNNCALSAQQGRSSNLAELDQLLAELSYVLSGTKRHFVIRQTFLTREDGHTVRGLTSEKLCSNALYRILSFLFASAMTHAHWLEQNVLIHRLT